MDGLLTLLSLSIVMAITSFVVGSLPLAFALSPTQLRFISSIGMGVLVGTSLIVIIPEGVETLYSATTLEKGGNPNPREFDADWWSDKLVSNARRSAMVEDSSFLLGCASPSLSAIVSCTPMLMPNDGSKDVSKANHYEGEIYQPQKRQDETPSEELANVEESSPHAWIGVALISGFILMYLIDKLPQFALPSKNQRHHYHISLDNLGSGLRRTSTSSAEAGLVDTGSPTKRSHGFATTTGLVIHAAADGIALGASTSNTSLSFIIFLAIMVHKAPASFGLTSVLLKQGLSTRTARAHLIFFSLAAPLGALASFFSLKAVGWGSAGEESSVRWRTGILLLFSAGTFLYVAMHTMQENGLNRTSRESQLNGYSESRDTQVKPDRLLKDLIASVVGMILPLFLQVGHAH